MLRPRCTCCNHVNPPASNYCIRCGAQLLLLACPSCEALNEAAARTCHNCDAAIPERDSGVLTRPSARAGDSVELAVSAIENDIKGPLRTRSSATTRARLPPDLVEADASSGMSDGWAGSSPAAFAGSSRTPSVSNTYLAHRSKPILIALAIAVIAGFGWYAYRYPVVDVTAQRTQSTDAIERDTHSSANNQSALPVGAQEQETNPRVERDGRASCTEAVAALGLCLPEPIHRKD